MGMVKEASHYSSHGLKRRGSIQASKVPFPTFFSGVVSGFKQ